MSKALVVDLHTDYVEKKLHIKLLGQKYHNDEFAKIPMAEAGLTDVLSIQKDRTKIFIDDENKVVIISDVEPEFDSATTLLSTEDGSTYAMLFVEGEERVTMPFEYEPFSREINELEVLRARLMLAVDKYNTYAANYIKTRKVTK